MKTNRWKRMLVCVALVAAQSVGAQTCFDFWSERFDDYLLTAESDAAFLRLRYFKDTVSVQEMKEAFAKHKDAKRTTSLYEGFDSLSLAVGGHGSSVMLLSPLGRHANKKVRECRGVWTAAGRCTLVGLTDKNGKAQQKLLDELNSDAKQRWLDGEMLLLEEPRWYMGFAVSPRLSWAIYDKGERLADISVSSPAPDFFAYAQTTTFGTGQWDKCLPAGARLMGAMCALENAPQTKGQGERTFSVLLHHKPLPAKAKSMDKPYTLELLEPATADKETQQLFADLKAFVENLPDKTFKPYYTTDFRIMTGRYYRVTANKCGWLIEDYLAL